MAVTSLTIPRVTQLTDPASAGKAWASCRTALADATGVRKATALDTTGPTKSENLRQRIGEFVGNVFYGKLIQQTQASKLKGPFLHGGRGEEVFQGQLGMELAKRLGRAPNDPVANRIYEAMQQGKASGATSAAEKMRMASVWSSAADAARALSAAPSLPTMAGWSGGER